DHGLHRALAAEEHALALVDEHERGPVALLGVDADVGLAGPRRDAPIHGADVVAGQVVADLLAVEAATPQPRGVASREDRVHRLARQEGIAPGPVPEPDQVVQLGIDARRRRSAHATATFSTTIFTTSSALRPSALAS